MTLPFDRASTASRYARSKASRASRSGGGGDSCASGLLYGLLCGFDLGIAVEYGAAHGARAMTTAGDTSMASLKEVESLVRGGGARVQR